MTTNAVQPTPPRPPSIGPEIRRLIGHSNANTFRGFPAGTITLKEGKLLPTLVWELTLVFAPPEPMLAFDGKEIRRFEQIEFRDIPGVVWIDPD